MPRPRNVDLPHRLMKEATALLEERGDTSFSMRELATRVDYAVTAIYREYRNRDDLLRALKLQLFMDMARFLDDDESLSVKKRVARSGRRFLQWAVEHQAQYRFLFHTTRARSHLKKEDRELARAGLVYFESLLRTGMERGEIKKDDPEALAMMLFSSLHGHLSLLMSGGFDDTPAGDVLTFFDKHNHKWLDVLLAPPKRGRSR